MPMYTDPGLKPTAHADTYTTPCGRYSVERAGAERYEVIGPKGFLDWFVDAFDARDFADDEASRNPPTTESKRSRLA